MIRLDKYLADMGAGTRQEVKKMIRQGKVTVDGAVIRSPEHKITEDNKAVALDGRPVLYKTHEYYMLNKPAGVVSATRDGRDRTVVDLIESRRRKDLFPVGRLDKDTEGLLLITNDGELAHRLLSPKKHVDKTYYAKIQGQVTPAHIDSFLKGVNIGTKEEPEYTAPARLEIVSAGPESEIRLTIQEGRYHQVKRMFQSIGMEVVYLKRERMGSLTLDEHLLPGQYRTLTDEERERL